MNSTLDPPRSSEDLFEEKLAQLESGVPLEMCIAGLAEEEIELLKLAAALQEAPYPGRDASAVSNQRAGFLRDLSQENKSTSNQVRSKSARWSLRNRLQPRTALVGALAALMASILIGLVTLTFLTDGSPENTSAENPPPDSAAGLPIDQHPPTELAPEQAIVADQAPIATVTTIYEAFVPLVSAARTPDPTKASLQVPQGLVQIQMGDGAWVPAAAGSVIEANQRLRTGELSSVLMAFEDGSWARLGPNSDVTVDELDARRSTGSRVVVLTQWRGETHHEVTPHNDAGSRYEVKTPSATSVAKGTEFQVAVVSNQLTLFGVDKGVVGISGQDVTVDLVAGQTTAVKAGQAPSEPAFRITGEGEVTQIGAQWIIAGQSFEPHAGTTIVGKPQVGDWVSVKGRLYPDDRRVADQILLLRRSPANRFTIAGRVNSIAETEWIVAGQTILVDLETDIDDEIKIDDRVQIEGSILAQGALLAEAIRLIEERPGLPFEFIGVVQEAAAETWRISGVFVAVDADTQIDSGLNSGQIVRVRGRIQGDGLWLARSIERFEDTERRFRFVGVVDSVDPWVVAGISFETRAWTEIEPGIGAGDLVKVKGQILQDGTWVASEISRLDDDGALLRFVFVGTVDGTNPWVVSGIPLPVDEDTIIDEDITVGHLVKVTVSILPDGAWLATRIQRLDVDDGGLGCVTITAVVVGVGPGWIDLPNWPPIDLKGVVVEGDLQVGSVILMLVCVGEDGSIDIVSIVVIYQPEPIEPPLPEPPPPEQGHKVTICHKANSKNAHTITISQSALQAHLNHGDTLGPCQ